MNENGKKVSAKQSPFVINELFDSTKPIKPADEQVINYPPQYGFTKETPDGVYARPVTLTKNGPPVNYEILQ